jgi:hypothetical protein
VNRAALVLALVSALFLGVSLGFMGGVLFANRQLDGGPRMVRRLHGPGGREGRGAPRVRMMPPAHVLVPWLQRELGLSDTQVRVIRDEIERSRTDLASVHDSLHARIARHLETSQRERFLRLVRERFPGDHRGRRPPSLRAEPGSEGEPK